MTGDEHEVVGVTRVSEAALLGTMIFGGLHAASSLYWGLGGRALLETIGEGAVELRDEAPWWIFPLLLIVAALKTAAVVLPFLHLRGRLTRPRFWRALCRIGGVGLVLYGGTFTVVAHAALSGVFGAAQDRSGLLGHAYIWDPLFLLWGLCLLVALISTPPRPTSSDPPAHRLGVPRQVFHPEQRRGTPNR